MIDVPEAVVIARADLESGQLQQMHEACAQALPVLLEMAGVADIGVLDGEVSEEGARAIRLAAVVIGVLYEDPLALEQMAAALVRGIDRMTEETS